MPLPLQALAPALAGLEQLPSAQEEVRPLAQGPELAGMHAADCLR